jgi:hypothetical protein
MSWTIDSGGIAGTPFLNNATYGNYTIPYWTFTGNNGKFVSKSAGDINRTQSGTSQSPLGFISGSSDFADLVSITNETPSQATSVTISPTNGTGTLISSYSGSRTKVIVYLVGAGGVGSGGLTYGFGGWLGGAGGGGGARLVAYSISSSYYIGASPNYLYPSWVGSASSYSSGTRYLTANSGGNGGSLSDVITRGTGGSAGGYSSASGYTLYCASNGASGAGGGSAGGSSADSATYWSGSLTLSASSGGTGGSSGYGGGGGGSSGKGGNGGNEVRGVDGTAPGGGGGGGGANFGNAYNGGNGASGTAIIYW